jgi:hypothetical protein
MWIVDVIQVVVKSVARTRAVIGRKGEEERL